MTGVLGRAGLLAWLASVTACSVELPNNAFECALDTECPADFVCVSGRCWRGSDVDAGDSSDGAADGTLDVRDRDVPATVDAGPIDGEAVDMGPFDAGGPDVADAGPDASDPPVPCADINLQLVGTSAVHAIVHDDDGNLFITGTFSGRLTLGDFVEDSEGAADIFVARIDAGGGVRWLHTEGGLLEDRGAALAVSDAGRLYFAGTIGEANATGLDSQAVWRELSVRTGAVLQAEMRARSLYTGIAVRGEDSFVTGIRSPAGDGTPDAIIDEITALGDVREVRRYDGGVLHAIADHVGSLWAVGTEGTAVGSRARAYQITDVDRPAITDEVFMGPVPATNISNFRSVSGNGGQIVLVGDLGVFTLVVSGTSAGDLVQQSPTDQPGKWFGLTFDGTGALFVGRRPVAEGGQLPMSGRIGGAADVDMDPDPRADTTAFAVTRSTRCARTFVAGRFQGRLAGMDSNTLSGYVITL